MASPFTLAVCAEMVFTDLPITERARRIDELGFQVEIWDWTRHDLDALAATGATFSSMTGYVSGDLTDPEGADELVASAERSIEAGATLGVPRLNLHGTGLDGRGLPVKPVEVVTGDMWLAAERTLGRLALLGEKAGVTFCLENLNTAVDHPGVPFARAADTRALVAAVDSPALRMMLDVYHAQIGEGNLVELIRGCGDLIGEVQVADVPGRCEPGTGEISYPAVARALDEIGYRGTVGLEAFASSDSELALDAFPRRVQPRLSHPTRPHPKGPTDGHAHRTARLRPAPLGLPAPGPVRRLPPAARRGAGLLQREVELVGAVALRRRAQRRARPGDVPLLRGHRHRRHREGPERPGLPARPGQPAARPDPPGDPALLPAAADRRAEAERAAGGPRARGRLAERRDGRPGHRAVLADAQRGVLPGARPALLRGRGRRPADALGARAQGPRARRHPAHPGGQGGHPGHPGLLRRAAQRPSSPAPQRPGQLPRAGRHRRHTVRRRRHQARLGDHGADDGAVPGRRRVDGRADQHRVQAAGREPRPARPAARGPLADPRRRRGDAALRHPAAAGRSHHLARGRAARRHHPGRRSRGAAVRRRQPRRAALPGPRHLRPPSGARPPPRVLRGHARLPGRTAGPARGADRPRGGAAGARPLRAGRRAASATPPPRTCTSGRTCRCGSTRRQRRRRPFRRPSRPRRRTP